MIARLAILLALGLCATAAQLRINCGGPYIGNIGWRKDTGKYRVPQAPFSRGFVSNNDVVASGNWAPVYKSHAYAFGTSDLAYQIPVPADVYNVFLLFAETWSGASQGVRQFSLTVNGEEIVPALDVFDKGGGLNRAVYIPISQVNATAGYVNVTLGRIPGKNNPMISGIVIEGTKPDGIVGNEGVPTPSVSASPSASTSAIPSVCSTTSVLLNAGGPAVGEYIADKLAYIIGPFGFAYTSKVPVTVEAGSNTAPLYLTERYTSSASLTYKIPVPAGTYTVTSMHAESYFTAAGKRVFNIMINGAEVETSFDIFVAAGNAKDVAVELTYTGIVSVDGFITISYIKTAQNNPLVNAIKIVSTCGETPTPTVSASVTSGVEPTITPTVSASASASASPSVGSCPGSPVLLNVGGLAEVGYSADKTAYIEGNIGKVYTSSVPVTVKPGSDTAPLYRTERFTEAAALTYKIPVQAGTYTVTSMHAESFFTAAGLRVFNILINGVAVETSFDIFVAAGNAKDVAVELTYRGIVPVDGFITISYIKTAKNNPLVNAIKIYPECGTPILTVTPTVSASASASANALCATDSINMNVGGGAVTGYVAENVAYITGPAGTASGIATPVTGADNADVFKTERYTTHSALTYKIPVAAGTYTVTTFHAESYVTAAGARLFSIAINGKEVKTNLDVFSAAGGKNIALVQKFAGVSSVDGFITISFVKGTIQNPFVNAIKITAECSTPSVSATSAPTVSAGVTPTVSPSVDPNLCDVAQSVTGRTKDAFSMNVGGPALGVFGAENVNYLQAPKGKISKSAVEVSLGGVTAPIFFTERFTDHSALVYKIPVPDGSYNVTTYHAESFVNTIGGRIFNIVINGNAVAVAVDVFESVGKNKAYVRLFRDIPSVGGFITIEFARGQAQNPFVNAIKINGVGADTLAIAGLEDGSCKFPL